MKALIRRLSVVLSLAVMAAPSAQAGLIFKSDALGGLGIFFGITSLLVAGATSGQPMCLTVTDGPFSRTDCGETEYVKGVYEGALIAAGGFAVMAILDADSARSVDQLEAELLTRYPFVDNAEAIHELAVRMNDQILNRTSDQGVISVSEEGVREIFAGVSLKKGELERIISDLR